jgi:hypothetical protein
VVEDDDFEVVDETAPARAKDDTPADRKAPRGRPVPDDDDDDLDGGDDEDDD